MRRKRFVALLTAAMLACLQVTVSVQVGADTDSAEAVFDLHPFAVDARSAVLLDVKTGTILYEQNPNESIAPASLAKVMTMLLALEEIEAGRLKLDDQVTVSEAAWNLARQGRPGGISAMFLHVGDQVSVEELLYGIGVVSGNDASLALAEHMAGTEAAFVRRMNERAAELGLRGTHFTDSDGLSPEARTTAMDMARLGAEFVNNHPDGLIYVNKRDFSYGGLQPQLNRNGLVLRDARFTGLKTGYLSVSGYHLVATAVEGEMSLVAAVLGAPSIQAREQVALELINYGFREFETISPAWGTDGVKQLRVYQGTADTVAVKPAERVLVTVPRELVANAEAIRVEERLPSHLVAPLATGEVVGELQVFADENVVAGFELVTTTQVNRAGFFKATLDMFRLWWARLLGR